eukprot:TRINITY_DN12794_c0_g1_i1.p1 TRINITY_DN12794_c0_g1~~TRINITY_DN12794_c0_g1_i1.p1  ORF type:complete len:291 (+),score=77.46 TRINITY_DN12794_c0_g1_i1:88-960(+)
MASAAAAEAAAGALDALLDAAYEVSAEQRECYERDGFVVVRGLLDPAVLEAYREPIMRKVMELNGLKHKPLEERTTYERAFVQVVNLWCKSEQVKRFVFGRRVASVAAQLMGCEGARLYHDQALCKESAGGITPAHVDQFYWPLASTNTITAWIPLQYTPLEMGPLCFVVGSHHQQEVVDTAKRFAISDESEAELKKVVEAKSLQVYEEAFALGDVSFHSGWTLHHAGENKSGRPREVMTMIYMDKDMHLAEPVCPEQERDREAFCGDTKVGDVIDGPLTPLLYDATASR